MAKWCFNYESGEYEYIEKDGFSIDRGEYVYNWDDSFIMGFRLGANFAYEAFVSTETPFQDFLKE